METVTSIDGTELAYDRIGEGPPLLLVHGTSGDRKTTWNAVVPQLRDWYTVYTIDRRGRGDSGDKAQYFIDREFVDVATMVSAIDGPVTLFGHSLGALCSLEAARLVDDIESLILYEPSLADEDEIDSGALEELFTRLDADDPEGILTTFLRSMGQTPDHVLEGMRAHPSWEARLDNAHTIPREIDNLGADYFDAERYRTISIPSLVITGNQSRYVELEAMEELAEALPNGDLTVLEGQGHTAMYTAPERLAELVIDYLES